MVKVSYWALNSKAVMRLDYVYPVQLVGNGIAREHLEKSKMESRK